MYLCLLQHCYIFTNEPSLSLHLCVSPSTTMSMRSVGLSDVLQAIVDLSIGSVQDTPTAVDSTALLKDLHTTMVWTKTMGSICSKLHLSKYRAPQNAYYTYDMSGNRSVFLCFAPSDGPLSPESSGTATAAADTPKATEPATISAPEDVPVDTSKSSVFAVIYGASVYRGDTKLLERVTKSTCGCDKNNRNKIVAARKERRSQKCAASTTHAAHDDGSGAAAVGTTDNATYKRGPVVRCVTPTLPALPSDVKEVSKMQKYVDRLRLYKEQTKLIESHKNQALKRLSRRPNIVIFVNSATGTAASVPIDSVTSIIRKVIYYHGCANDTVLRDGNEKQGNPRVGQPILYDVHTGKSVRVVGNTLLYKSVIPRTGASEDEDVVE